MLGMRPEASWRRYGKENPYYGVLSDERFLGTELDEEARAAFFASGEDHVSRLLAILRELTGFEGPRRALDYGCGVGRLAIPLARRCGEVVGVDVSPGMLAEARRNCERLEVRNLVLAEPGAAAAREGRFDLVHSFIVFQHMRPRAGEAVARDLVARLEPGGAGALHFTYARRASRLRRVLQQVRQRVPLAHELASALQGRRGLPNMQMNAYDLNRLLGLLQDAGCDDLHVRFTDHASHRGVLLLFRKRAVESF